MTKQFTLYMAAVLACLSLCASRCATDEPSAAPGRRPAVPPAEADPGRDPDPVPGPAPGPTEEEWQAMAAEAAGRASVRLYYSPYRVGCVVEGDPAAAFGGRPTRLLALLGYEDGAETYVRHLSSPDRWSLFFGERAGALALAEAVADLEEEASRRPLYPAEEARLGAMRAELAAHEAAALAAFRLVLVAEAGGRRFPIDTLQAGILLSAPPPPAGFPRVFGAREGRL